MMIRFLSLIIGVIGALLACTASAHGAQTTYSVPGVVNTGQFATIFLCANHSDVSVTVTIEVFDGGGTLQGSLPTTLAPGTAVAISTEPITSLPTTSMNLGSFIGSAKVTYAAKGPVCTAWVQGPGSTAAYMNGLPFFRKGIQK